MTTSLMRGGAEIQVFLLARTLARRGHQVELVSLRDAEAYEDELKAEGIPFTSLGMRQGIADPRAVVRLSKVIRRQRPHVVHGHMVHANLLTRITRPFAPHPVLVSTAHNLTEGARWRELAYRWTDHLATMTTNVSPSAVARYVEVGAAPAAKIRCVPNGLDLTPFFEDPARRRASRSELGLDHRFLWLAVGRLEAQKDYPTMLRAAARLKEIGNQVPLFTILIVSDGPLRAELEHLREELGITEDEVRFLGARADVPDLMRASDGYVMSSAWEGLPMVLLEAAAARLPVVATDVGGNRDIVRHGETGWLLPASDAQALADHMAGVMRMAATERRSWGDAARRRVEEGFKIEDIVSRWEELYEALLAASG